MPDSSDIVHCVCVFCLLKKSLTCSLKLRGLCLCADEDGVEDDNAHCRFLFVVC